VAFRGYIGDNPGFHQKHLSAPVGSDGSDETLYPLMEKYMLPVANLPPILCAWICTIRTTRLFHSLLGFQLCSSSLHIAWQGLSLVPAKCHIIPLRYCYISDAAISPYMFSFGMLTLITIQSSLQIHCLPLHLLPHYHILQVWNILSNLHTL